MNTRAIAAALVGSLAHFGMGFLLYGFFFLDFMASQTQSFPGLQAEGMGTLLGFSLHSLFYGVLLSYILQLGGVHRASRGMVVGATVSLLGAASVDLMQFFVLNLYSWLFIVVDIMIFGLIGAVSGSVVAAVLKPRVQLTERQASIA